MRPRRTSWASRPCSSAQVRRMLADPRAAVAGQELRRPVAAPAQPGRASSRPATISRSSTTRCARRCARETEMLLDSLRLENRSVLDLLRADYTFANERLARHYGMRGVYGSHFRRVPVTDPARYGLLGHASVLAVTSYPNRTSPVVRGQVDSREHHGHAATAAAAGRGERAGGQRPGKLGSVRARLAAHRSSPQCASCHRVMDPLGFALENFDAVGAWRTDDQGTAIDASDTLVDGTQGERPGGAASGPAAAAGDVRDRAHREAADLRARTRHRSRRHAGGSRHRPRRRRRRLPFRRDRPRHRRESVPFQMREASSGRRESRPCF